MSKQTHQSHTTSADSKSKNTSSHAEWAKATGLWTGFGVVLLAVLLSGGYVVFAQNYKNEMYPGVRIAGQDVGGMSFDQVLEMLQAPISTVQQEGLSYRWQDYDVSINPTVSEASGSFAFDFLTFDVNGTVDEAYSIGRGGTFWENIREQLETLALSTSVSLRYEMDNEQLETILRENFAEFEVPAQNALLLFDETGMPTASSEEPGKTFDYDALVDTTHEKLQTLDTSVIELAYILDEPDITQANARTAVAQARAIVDVAPIVFTYEDKTWEMDAEQIQQSLALGYDDAQGTHLTFVSDSTQAFLETIADEIDVDKKEGKFEVQSDGSIVQIQEGQNGLELDIEATLDLTSTEVLENHNTTVALVTQETQPEFTNENVADLSIQELLGEGRSNFAGSPTNRIHNIQHGSNKLHGLLIAPEQEFSLVKALRPFTLEDGWREELVIKGNKTIPEVGGGGCQLGTTMFRSAMDVGLPITSRRNHSYTVSYYQENGLPGTDATIYDTGGDNPQPDFRFVNDTGNYILIQTHIEGTELIFSMWGTSDGRSSSRTTPVVNDYVAPPPSKTIETTDLAPGQVKCVERAHTGMTASFQYSIVYADGTIQEDTFTSKYKPWQEVCLVGVDPNKDKLTQETPEDKPGEDASQDQSGGQAPAEDDSEDQPTE